MHSCYPFLQYKSHNYYLLLLLKPVSSNVFHTDIIEVVTVSGILVFSVFFFWILHSCAIYCFPKKRNNNYFQVQNFSMKNVETSVRKCKSLSTTLNAIFGESRSCTEELLSPSYPSFYAESDFVNNTHTSGQVHYCKKYSNIKHLSWIETVTEGWGTGAPTCRYLPYNLVCDMH